MTKVICFIVYKGLSSGFYDCFKENYISTTRKYTYILKPS